MKVEFSKVEKVGNLYTYVLMDYSDENKAITRSLNNQELALLNAEEKSLEDFAVQFANECNNIPTVQVEVEPVILEVNDGVIQVAETQATDDTEESDEQA